MTHGATSQRRLEPLREKHRAELRERFPRLDQHRLQLLADLLARCDAAREYLDRHGLMNSRRAPHPLLAQVERWEARAWKMMTELAPKREATEEIPLPDDLLDPFVRQYTTATLGAIHIVGKRNQGDPIQLWEWPPLLAGRGWARVKLSELTDEELSVVEAIVNRQEALDPWEPVDDWSCVAPKRKRAERSVSEGPLVT